MYTVSLEHLVSLERKAGVSKTTGRVLRLQKLTCRVPPHTRNGTIGIMTEMDKDTSTTSVSMGF